MSFLDTEALLRPISEADPCGEDLRYDRRYLEVMKLAEGTPEQEIARPDGTKTVIPAEEPAWGEVKDGCVELMARTKDLRIAMLLALSALRLGGYEGIRDGLLVVQGCVDRFWDGVHPRLDPDDGNDPTERLNIIASLAVPPASFGDPMKFQDRVREAPLARGRAGSAGLREVMMATGELPPPSDPNAAGVDANLIDAIFHEADTQALENAAAVAEQAGQIVASLEQSLTERVGVNRAVDISSFKGVFDHAVRELRKRLAARGVGAAAGENGESSAGYAGGGGGGGRLAGEIVSGDDVITAIEKIVRYYESREPSSPVPLFMHCARRLVGKGFQDIYKLLPPDSVSLLERVTTEQTSS
ncbi:MAG: type VI secretion system protein TssA [Phycisphaerales bacterium]|nr:type VI secretion system protein TssA [Phycisphaerales bacterium]